MTKAEVIEKAERLERRAAEIRRGTFADGTHGLFTGIDPLWQSIAEGYEARARGMREAVA